MNDEKIFLLDIFDIGDFPVTTVSGILLISFMLKLLYNNKC